jgi:hypothetical protein
MCYITPKAIDEDEFIENFLNGDYNDFLDRELAAAGWKPEPPAAPTAAKDAGTHAQTPEQRVTVAPVQSPAEPAPEPDIAPKTATDGYTPGQWAQRSDDREERIAEMMASAKKLNKSLSDEEAREFAELLVDETTDETDVRFINGPHEVIFRGSLSPEKQQTFLSYVDHMQSKFPANRKMAIRVDPSTDFEYGVGGETTLATGHMRINERVMQQDFWPGMPVSKEVPSALYVLAHEWGHAFPDKADARNTHVHSHAVAAGGMTKYGTHGGEGPEGHASEGYAEAFAEWSLSEGKTTNAAAQEYARQFHWKERFGN